MTEQQYITGGNGHIANAPTTANMHTASLGKKSCSQRVLDIAASLARGLPSASIILTATADNPIVYALLATPIASTGVYLHQISANTPPA